MGEAIQTDPGFDGWEIKYIPGQLPDPDRYKVTVNVVVAKIEPKTANVLVRQLNAIAPLENLGHVKRIRRNAVDGGNIGLSIILFATDGNSSEILEDLPNDVLELVKSYQLLPFIAEVPKFAPLSREQWEFQCECWPTSFHPNACNDWAGDELNSIEVELAYKFMKLAIDNAKVSNSDSQVINTAVIVDPSMKCIIASGSDQTGTWDFSRSKHIASVDHLNGQMQMEKPVSQSSISSSCHSEESNMLCSTTKKQDDIKFQFDTSGDLSTRDNERYLCHPLHHAVMVAIEMAAARDLTLFPDFKAPKCDENFQSSSTIPAIEFGAKRQKINEGISKVQDRINGTLNGCNLSSEGEDLTRPYLCTGFDVYVVREPCIMCAMALVHQRVRRVFFAIPNSKLGALGSAYRLHGEKSLNHHYSVHRIVIPDNALKQ